MKEQCKFKESCAFKNNIAEITSISLECNYEVEPENIDGSFLIEGSYRTHELSINQDNYSFRLPFEYRLKDNCIKDSVNLSVIDFTYTTADNNLIIEIEYEETFDVEEEINTKEDFDRFLEEHEVEIVDLSSNALDEEKVSEYLKEERIIPEATNEKVSKEVPDEVNAPEEERVDNIEINNEIVNTSNVSVTNTIIDNIKDDRDEYITYHVYICTDYDTLNSIADKFKVSVEILKNYNNVETITSGMKIIVPASNDEN